MPDDDIVKIVVGQADRQLGRPTKTNTHVRFWRGVHNKRSILYWALYLKDNLLIYCFRNNYKTIRHKNEQTNILKSNMSQQNDKNTSVE